MYCLHGEKEGDRKRVRERERKRENKMERERKIKRDSHNLEGDTSLDHPIWDELG